MNGAPARRRRLSYTSVVLLAAAIVALYWIGYLRTRDAAGALAVGSRPSEGGLLAGARYRDGTYSATGTGAHGDVSVEVMVQAGRISEAAVTGCTTQYPCSDVSPLQSQVIERQSADVDAVSRATDSSIAYINAVRSALGKAQT